MISCLRVSFAHRFLFVAVPLAFCLLLLVTGISEAHAILLQSDPAKDAVLKVAPSQVHLWFSEDLNPTTSTVVVLTSSNQRVDRNDAHVSKSDPRQMDVSLHANLRPGVYVVVWRSQSAADGHILRGSFLFTLALPDGTIPALSGNTSSAWDVLGGENATGQLDGPSLVTLSMLTLVELGTIFWVGAYLWCLFVLRPSTEAVEEEGETNQRIQQRFEQHFALPTLLVVFLANCGIVAGQALSIAGGRWATAFTPSLLLDLITTGRFGLYWLMSQVVIICTMLLLLATRSLKQRSPTLEVALPWSYLLVGFVLFFTMTMSGHAATVNSSFVIFPLMVDWLHLLAAAFWIGGMLYIAIIYLPILRSCSLAEQAFSLTSVLPYYVPWALFGVGLIAMTGPLNTTFHLHSWAELLNTAYGRVLVVKILLVVGLVSTSAIHLLLLRPRLKKIYVQYVDAVAHGELDQGAASADGTRPPDQAASEPGATRVLLSQEGKQLESRLAKHTRTLTRVLRWEPLMGAGVLVCTGLLTLLAGTVPPAPVNSGQSATGSSRPFTTTVSTTDNKFTVTLTVTPNRFGTNVFTVSVLDSNGTQDTNVGVSLYTTFLDSEIGTTTINLQPDNKGHFSASGDLSMGGNWQIRIQIRTPDNTLHETTVNLFTSS